MTTISNLPTTAIPRPLAAFDAGSHVVFFGNSLSVECQRCNAFCATSRGHKYCVHVTCPLALKEFKRRKRKRTSTLEQVYLPKLRSSDTAGPDDDGERDGRAV